MRHYEYLCSSCGNVEERYRSTAERDDPVPCSRCGKPAERTLSAFLPMGPTPLFSPPGGTPPPPPTTPPQVVKPRRNFG